MFYSGFIPGAPLLVGQGAGDRRHSEGTPASLASTVERGWSPGGSADAQGPLGWAAAPARATCSRAPASPPRVPPPRRARAPRSLPPAWREHWRRLPGPRARPSCQRRTAVGERRAAGEPERGPREAAFAPAAERSGTEMLLLRPGPARGRGRGPAGAPRGGLSLSWSPAWICCWALAGCQAAWAGDLSSSSGRPLPPCQEVSRAWSFTWSLRGRRKGEGERRVRRWGWWLFIALSRRLVPSLEDRGFRLFQEMKLPAPGSWPGEALWLCCLLGEAFLFGLLCFRGSEGLCGALFGVPGLRTWGRGRDFSKGRRLGKPC